MSGQAGGEWVRQGTPRDGAEPNWDDEQNEYGTPVSPTEWDDYSSEQSVPVPPPPAETESPADEPHETVPGQEPDQGEEYRSDEPEVVEDAPAGDPDDDGVEPERTEPLSPSSGATYVESPVGDPDATAVHPVTDDDHPLAHAPAAVAAAGAVPADIYRHDRPAPYDSGDETAVLDQAPYEDTTEQDEDERLAAQLEADRRARNERLGVVSPSTEDELRDPEVHWRRDNDRFFPSLALFLLRLATAAVVGVIGYQILTDIDATSAFLSQTMIPEPTLVSWILGFTFGVLALLLVIGMLQRVVGFLLLVAAAGSLAFIRWGDFSPFIEGREGFLGDRTLLLATIALVLLALGGGAWGVDGAYRRGRARSKAEKLA